MTVLAVTALLLVGPPKADVVWSTSVPFALAWAKRVNKPVLAAGMGSQRGVSYLTDPSFDQVLSTFVPVEAATYGDLTKVSKGIPISGVPQIVVLDSSGRMLKRLGGFGLRPSDLDLLKVQVEWIQSQGDSIVRKASKVDADADTLADAATVLAMRADPEGAMQKLAAATAKHAKPSKIINAWEALADEARISGSADGFTQTIRYYRVALDIEPDSITESRIHCRLASALWRTGDVNGAIEQAKIVIANPKFPSDDQARAKRLLDRMLG